MKKIININLSGRVIPIEDSAYEKLQVYVESLRRHFAQEEGRDEIINDIESRIAELMNDKVRKGAACVTDADMDEIIASMGRPEDFDAEPAEGAAASSQPGGSQSYSGSTRTSRGRLYRDASDKFIGGVCSGIANYLNIDPAIVRILFVIMFFGGFGFLAYILLWLIVPARDLEGFSGKRLYRNPDDRVIGGVAGGLAAYFNIRTSNVRLIFAAPILFSIFFSLLRGFSWHYDFDIFPNIFFGSLSSTFLFAYIILWIVLPEARTAYEKMEMRGEKVDVNSIRQNVREGMENVKDRVKGWGEEVKESAQQFSSRAKEYADTRGKTFAREFSETARSSGRGIGHAIAVVVKAFFLFIVGMIAFGLCLAVMGLIFGGIAFGPVNNFLWTSHWQKLYAWGTLIFFLFVPLLGIIIWILRRIIRVRSHSNYLGWTFAFLWIIGWVSAVLLAASLSRDFSEFERVDSPMAIMQPAHGKMVVVASQPELQYTGRFGWISNGREGWDLNSDTIRLSTVDIPDPVKSPDSLYHVIIWRNAYGNSVSDARNRAEKVQYSANYSDSVLDLSPGYAIGKEDKFRLQQIEIEIQVPAGKKIRFDQSVLDKLTNGSFRVRRYYRRRGNVRLEIEDRNPHGYRANIDYTMGIDGLLKDPAGNTVNNYDYRYHDDTDNKPSIEEQKRKVEEEQKKLKELEDQQRKKDSLKSSARKTESMEDDQDDVASTPSPVFSMVKSFL